MGDTDPVRGARGCLCRDLQQGAADGVRRAGASAPAGVPALLPVYAHLALVLMLGVFIPPYLAQCYQAAARLIGGQ